MTILLIHISCLYRAIYRQKRYQYHHITLRHTGHEGAFSEPDYYMTHVSIQSMSNI